MLIKSIISIKWKVLKKSKISLKSIIWFRLRQVLVKCWSNAGQGLVNFLISAGHVLSMAGHNDNVDKIYKQNFIIIPHIMTQSKQ